LSVSQPQKRRVVASRATNEQLGEALNLLVAYFNSTGISFPGLTLTAPLLLPDGSAGAPGLAFALDTDTGLMREGNNQAALSAGGNLVLHWAASGILVTNLSVSGGLNVGAASGALTGEVRSSSHGYVAGGLNVGTASGAAAGEVRASGGASVAGGVNVGTATGALAGEVRASSHAMLGGGVNVGAATGALVGEVRVPGKVGIGAALVPTVPLQVQDTFAANYLALIKQLGGAGAKGISIEIASTAATDDVVSVLSNGVKRFSVDGAGGVRGKNLQAIAKPPLLAFCTANTALTTSPANVPGASVTLSEGLWTITGTWRVVQVGAGDLNVAVTGTLAIVSGTATIANPSSGATIYMTVAGQCWMLAQTWTVTVPAGSTPVLGLQIAKSGGSGTSVVAQNDSVITAAYCGNP
jgi:hypothetical protein